MNTLSGVVCREVFDENSQPSAEEISEYAQQLGIDPESESHLLPLARDGLMQALPPPWKAYYDEKLQTHYYYNEETKKTQWDHPLDDVYKELVKKARDASVHDDTCASVQELPTSEEITKHLERFETKVESDDEDLTTDSENQGLETNNSKLTPGPRRLAPLGRPPLAPMKLPIDKKLAELRVSPLRRSAEAPISPKPALMRNTSDRDLYGRPPLERPKMLFKQQSETFDLKMRGLSPDDESYSTLLAGAKIEKGLPLPGKSGMHFRVYKSELPSPDTDKSLPLDSMTKSDPPKGILREKMTENFHRKPENLMFGRQKQAASLDEDRKSVRFKLEARPETTVSPGSNSSSEQNDGQSSIISANPSPSLTPAMPSSILPMQGPIVLSPLIARPPLPPKTLDSPSGQKTDSPREVRSVSSDKESMGTESDSHSRGLSPKRRLLRPPAGDYIKPDLFQKNFHRISDLVRPGELDPGTTSLEEAENKEIRPRSPMIPQKNKISINLMESIESETSIDSPDKEFANLDLNDLDESNITLDEVQKSPNSENRKEIDEFSDKASIGSRTSAVKSPRLIEVPIPQIKVPKLDFTTKVLDSEDSKKSSPVNEDNRKSTIEIKESVQPKLSPTPSLGSEYRSPRADFSKPWSSLSTFKPMNKAVIAPQMKCDSSGSFDKGLTSPRLDGVILSQGKSTDNVVVMYQFETQEQPRIKSPMMPDSRDIIERNKQDERRRLELALQRELEGIRVEWTAKERRMRAELQAELREIEEKFKADKRLRLMEQAEKHEKEYDDAFSASEIKFQESLDQLEMDMREKYTGETMRRDAQFNENMMKLHNEYRTKLLEQKEKLQMENERALAELREQLQANLNRERSRMIEENRAIIESLREEHTNRITDLRHDYRVEVERLRTQHACHLEELRARLSNERAASRTGEDRGLADKYKCLKEKYARLKHDVKMSIERRNKRREMSMTTGSETEKSNSHKNNQSLEKCKEVNETSVSAIIEPEPRTRLNNNSTSKYNDNETSFSESNAQKSLDNNNDDWKKRDSTLQTSDVSQTADASAAKPRKTAVAFKEPPRRRRDKEKETVVTDQQDSSDATTADEKPKEPLNSHGRRRCFTRLKSASTSRLNYSPKRNEGWSSPLESLRQQLRKLDDLEEQFPDLACNTAYSCRYPFTDLGGVMTADSAELEFVRHRALIEREGMRRARAVLKRRSAALKETRAHRVAHNAPNEEREVTELEVALHRARALLGEKEIRLKYIERALRKLSGTHPPLLQEAVVSEASSEGGEAGAGAATGAVLRSLRALHADVRDIWRALDATRTITASPETSSCNAPSTSQTRMTPSAPDQETDKQDLSDEAITEKTRSLRAWLQTAP